MILRRLTSDSRIWLFAAIVWLSPVLEAQERAPRFFRSTDQFLPSTIFSFERMLNTLNWTGLFSTDVHSGIWSFAVDQRYRTRAIHGLQRSHQDEYSGAVDASAALSQNVLANVSFVSQVTADDRAGDLGATSLSRILAGGEYVIDRNMRVGVTGGYEWNRQGSIEDRGMTYAIRFNGTNVSWDEFTMYADGEWSESLLDRRRPSTGNARLVLWREFAPGTDDSLTIDYSTQKRSFYVAAGEDIRSLYSVDQNIFDRSAEGWGVQNRLRYRMNEDLRLSLDAGISARTIERGNRYRIPGTIPVIADATVQEFYTSASGLLEWNPVRSITLLASMSVQSREERHLTGSFADLTPEMAAQQSALARRLENVAARTTAWVGGDIALLASNRLHVRASASILRYDTPDTMNTDDRDELYLTFRAEDEQWFGGSTRLLIGLDLTGAHLVYLSRVQSANNAWNRIIRLSAQLLTRPMEGFENVLRAEVIGNYTASDYEEQVASVRSFSFRQAAWNDSLSVRLSHRVSLVISGGFRITDRGSLRWKEFRERPEDEMRDYSVWPRCTYSMKHIRFTAGYRYFVQDRFAYKQGARVFQQSYASFGPAGSVEWMGDSQYGFLIEGWRETQQASGRSLATVPNVSLNVRLPL